MNNLEISQEISTKDQDGNLWMMKLSKPDTKTNRWQLSFFFNDKEFSLAKPQNNQSAQNFWELIQKTRFLPKIENKIEEEEEQEEIQVSKYKERPKKRALKK
jgi:hypothetical protein